MGMNRRRFLELLGATTVGATVAYSFPSVIVPRTLGLTLLDVAPVSFSEPIGISNAMHFFTDEYRLYCMEYLRRMHQMASHVTDFSTTLKAIH